MPKKASITFLRSSRFGSSRYLVYADSSSVDLLAGRELDLRPRDVRVGEDRVGRAAGVVHEPELRDQRLAFVVKRVRREAKRFLQREAVDRKRRVFLQELGDPVLAEMQHLGVDERGRLAEARLPRMSAFWSSSRNAGLPGVLGRLLAGIGRHPVVALRHVGLQVEALAEARDAIAQMALAVGKFLELAVELVGVCIPCGGRRVDLREVPAVGDGFGANGRGEDDSDDNRNRKGAHEGPRKGWRSAGFYASRGGTRIRGCQPRFTHAFRGSHPNAGGSIPWRLWLPPAGWTEWIGSRHERHLQSAPRGA